jgi:hypothetical protein
MATQISQSILNEIKSVLGYPLVETLDFGDNTDNYIVDNVISRVLRTYFVYFPIRSDTNITVNGSFEIAYPDTTVYKMLRYFFNYKNVNFSSFSPFLLQAMTISRGNYFSDYSNNQVQEAILRLSTAESMVDFTKAVQLDDYPNLRKIKGYTNISGDITVEWAKKSENFSDIMYNYQEDAIKLAKAYFIQDIYRLREQVKLDTKVTINTAALKEDATQWEAEVVRKWKNRGFAVIVKN